MTADRIAHRLTGPIRTAPKRAMLVAQRIVDEIVSGGHRHGHPLKPEREMLIDYGVARGTLREALRFLELQGIISLKTGPRGGPFVGEAGPQSLRPILAMFLQLNGATYRKLLEARMGIDPMLARAAADNVSDAELEALEECLQTARTKLDDWETFQRLSDTFHHLVVQATGNPIFTVVMEALDWIPVAEALGITFSTDVEESALAEHQAIYDALRARDGDRAEAVMREHMEGLLRVAAENYPEVLDRPIRWDIMQ